MSDIKIKLLICYHKKAPLFKDNILTPIHVGRALAKEKMDPESEDFQWLMDNLTGDDTGDNISEKNSSYNEMTAVYWAWKNYDKLGNPDYIGLMHYRRHFILDDKNLDVVNVRNMDKENYLDILNYSEENLKKLVEGCDFLPHIGKVNNVYRHYTENQRKEDIDLASRIILEKYPEYKDTMERYYAGDFSNFCNMCIFSRDLFFSYCEWIFSILEEFERRTDSSEKRFFISERLTGIFVARLMEDKSLKYKKLPIAFIDEPAKIPVSIYLDPEEPLPTALTIESIGRNSDGYNSYIFYIFCPAHTDQDLKDNIRALALKYEKCQVSFMESSLKQDLLPLYIPKLLPDVNKCIFISGNTIALKDIGEFYRICSVDDYFLTGVPEEKYDPAQENKRISQDLLVLNCKRMRSHDVAAKASEASVKDGTALLNKLCSKEIGYIPWYLFTSEKIELSSDSLFYSGKRRDSIKAEALWRPFLIYDRLSPLENHQGIYASYWWENLIKLPLCFQNIKPNLYVLKEMYAEQQKEINLAKEGKFISSLTPNYAPVEGTEQEKAASGPQEESAPREEWRSYGFWGKLKFYYDNNGFKNTVSYAFKKLSGGNKQ